MDYVDGYLGCFYLGVGYFFHYSPLFSLPDRADGRNINNYLFTFNKIDLSDASNAFCYAGFLMSEEQWDIGECLLLFLINYLYIIRSLNIS